MKKTDKPKITPAEFRKSMGFNIKSKPANMNEIADAIRQFAEEKRKPAKCLV